MVANAAVGDVVSVNDPAHADPATAATTNPGYALATEASNDGNLATASYVKGAYNAAIKAINKVAATAGSAVQSVTEGSTNGTVSVDGTDVAVHGLGSAAYTASTDYVGCCCTDWTGVGAHSKFHKYGSNGTTNRFAMGNNICW